MQDTFSSPWNGMVMAFNKVNPNSTVLQRVVALATAGRHYHLECVFAKRDSEDGHYDLDSEYWTSYMGHPFQCFPNREGHFNDAEWDMFFIDMTPDAINNVRMWLLAHCGAPYNYYDAFMSAFSTRHLLPSTTMVPEERSLFCSEVGCRLLQISGAVDPSLNEVVADRCSPERLFKLLVQYKQQQVSRTMCRYLL
jgi:hypothetical protein